MKCLSSVKGLRLQKEKDSDFAYLVTLLNKTTHDKKNLPGSKKALSFFFECNKLNKRRKRERE